MTKLKKPPTPRRQSPRRPLPLSVALVEARRPVVAALYAPVSEEFFRDILDEQFSEEESRRQLETAIQWGRYAEIFDYDSASGKLTLTEV